MSHWCTTAVVSLETVAAAATVPAAREEVRVGGKGEAIDAIVVVTPAFATTSAHQEANSLPPAVASKLDVADPLSREEVC